MTYNKNLVFLLKIEGHNFRSDEIFKYTSHLILIPKSLYLKIP